MLTASYSCTLTKINNFLVRDQYSYAEKQLHFYFKSVRVCYFNIDLGMSSLSNKWEPFFSNIHVYGQQTIPRVILTIGLLWKMKDGVPDGMTAILENWATKDSGILSP